MYRRERGLWLPAGIVLIGWALSLATWWSLISERRQAIVQSTDELAAESRQLVAKAVESQLAALDELARVWTVVGADPSDHWQAGVGLLRRSFPSVDYVAWVQPGGEVDRVSPASARSDPWLSTLAGAPSPSDATFIGPEREAGGSPSLRLLLPVGREGEGGLLAARIDLESQLGGILRGMSPGYALRVYWGDEVIFSRGEPSTNSWQEWWRVERSVELAPGLVWQVTHRPTDELATSLLTPIPHYLLASGLALWLILAALAHQLRITLSQSRFLAATNRALEERGDELGRAVDQRTRELEDVVSELRAFNQTVSHDLRSPLGAVLNFTAILEEDYRGRVLDAEGMEILGRIRRSAIRAARLLEGVLHLSRAGRVALDIAPVDLGALAREIFVQVRVAEDDDDVELVVGDVPAVAGDRDLLGDVLVNLFTNALKYSRGCEKRRITVAGRIDGDDCVFEVADTGRGFDMRFKDKLFGTFERLEAEHDVEGTGVGLAIVHRIVRRHGGRVWAQSEPGIGARFFFSLPRTQDAS